MKSATWHIDPVADIRHTHVMDFDTLAKELSRGRALKLFGSSALALFVPGLGPGMARARGRKHKKKQRHSGTPRRGPSCSTYGEICPAVSNPLAQSTCCSGLRCVGTSRQSASGRCAPPECLPFGSLCEASPKEAPSLPDPGKPCCPGLRCSPTQVEISTCV